MRRDKNGRHLQAIVLALAAVGSACAQPGGDQPREGAQVAGRFSVEAHLIALDTPLVRTIAGVEREIFELVEFVVTSPAPIPARALDPVLVLGDRVVTEYRYQESNVLVFTEYEAEQLPDGELLYFRWGEPVGEYRGDSTDFTFRRGQLEVIRRE